VAAPCLLSLAQYNWISFGVVGVALDSLPQHPEQYLTIRVIVVAPFRPVVLPYFSEGVLSLKNFMGHGTREKHRAYNLSENGHCRISTKFYET
jgi:hypothetical protein